MFESIWEQMSFLDDKHGDGARVCKGKTGEQDAKKFMPYRLRLFAVYTILKWLIHVCYIRAIKITFVH